MIKDVAVYDPLLAGWYSIWVGMTFYAEGSTDAAIDLFDDARRRINRPLPLPRHAVKEDAQVEKPKTFLEDALRAASTGSVSKVNDGIAKLRASVGPAFSTNATHKQAEEAVRVIGASLGFFSESAL